MITVLNLITDYCQTIAIVALFILRARDRAGK